MQFVSKITLATFDFNKHFNNKVVAAHCFVQYWQIFSSFLIFCYYFTHLKAHEISSKYDKLRKYFPYCTQHHATTTAGFELVKQNRFTKNSEHSEEKGPLRQNIF